VFLGLDPADRFAGCVIEPDQFTFRTHDHRVGTGITREAVAELGGGQCLGLAVQGLSRPEDARVGPGPGWP
jgi:hypothetical protein